MYIMNWKKYLLGVRLLLLCLTLGFAACSDDDKPNEEQQIEQELADAAAFWNVVGQLTDDVMPDEGWQKATYAPSIGEADGTNSTMRIVQCADIENAAESFADLVGLTDGKDITADTKEYTYKSDLVGTLTYRRTGGETLATVDVDIPQMPGLQQIVYRKVVENASFSGTAYYRFGDVVAKQNADGQTDYWICVRPAFGPAGKGDSHWISLSKIPSANVKTVNKTVSGQKLTHLMPKSLCTNQEHMQNLAELLYAMLFPAQWAKNLEDNNGYKTLKYFKDFDYVKLFKYHNDSYFRMVDSRWTDFYGAVFGLTAAEMREELQTNGLNLIYGTATMSGNNISLPMATFYQTNLKTKVLSKKTSTWDKQSFNIYDLTKQGYATFTNAAGGSEKAWVVRYATGATLAKGSAENPTFDKQKKLPNCQDVIVFNRDIDHIDISYEALKITAPKEYAVAAGYEGNDSHYHYGDIYKDEDGNRWFVISMSGKTKMGVEEGSPYAELITFDGIKFTADGGRAINLPTREQAIRGAYWLTFLQYCTQLQKYFTKEEWEEDTHNSYSPLYLPILNYAGYRFTDLMQSILAQNGNPRQTSLAASIAYNDPTSSKQHLIRWVLNNQNSKNDIVYYAWDHYPSQPSATAQKVTDFSNNSIFLQDIADPNKVARYAEDSYVRQPLHSYDGPVETPNLPARQPRSNIDERANYATNYVYNLTTWWNREFCADMWNAPVVMFRITRVQDRGENDYSTVTVDGHRLKASYQYDWDNDEDGLDMFRATGLSLVYANRDFIHLDGKKIGMPAWQTAW